MTKLRGGSGVGGFRGSRVAGLRYFVMEIPRPPAAVTFDCWETLLTNKNWDQTVDARVEALVRLASGEDVELTKERARELIEGSWQQHMSEWRAGRPFGSRGASRWCLEQLGLHADEKLADELAQAIEGVSTVDATRVVDGANDAVLTIRKAGIPTALICDTGFTPGRIVRQLLGEHGIELDHYFFSDEVGSPKPYPPIFTAALEATGADPNRAVHIGDLRRTDIAGARTAGMATIRFAGMHDDGGGAQSWDGLETSGDEADCILHSWAEIGTVLGIE
jgi:FMN phosphatase YigB (HAD superfamily)